MQRWNQSVRFSEVERPDVLTWQTDELTDDLTLGSWLNIAPKKVETSNRSFHADTLAALQALDRNVQCGGQLLVLTGRISRR